MAERGTGKAKAQRIELDYYRKGGWLARARWIGAIVAASLSLAYAAYVLMLDQSHNSNSRATHLSTGSLAQVHASFENDCQKCHASSFTVSLATDAWKLDPQKRLAHQESACQTCHQVSGHFRDVLAEPDKDRDCASCHEDHQGRAKLLTAVANSRCASCHEKLSSACRSGHVTELKGDIKEFSIASHAIAGDNGASTFRSLVNDPGRIKFDHAQHLQPGQVEAGSKGGLRLNMLPEAWRQRYRREGQSDDDFVQLDSKNCNACHEPLSVSHAPRSVAENYDADDRDIERGRFYAPVNFERHCSACHQLTFAGQTSEHLPLTHAAPRTEIKQLLAAKLIGGKLTGALGMVASTASGSAADAGSGDSSNPIDRSQQPVVLDAVQLEQAVSAVFSRCEQCHVAEDVRDANIMRARAGLTAPLIPQRWLQFGAFNHAAHGKVQCSFCHDIPRSNVESRSTGSTAASDHQKVMIKGPESCVPCHSTNTGSDASGASQTASGHRSIIDLSTEAAREQHLGNGKQPGNASADCTLCHQYHWTRPQPISPTSRATPVAAASQTFPDAPTAAAVSSTQASSP